MYLLDTNTCIQFLNGTSPAVKDQFQQHAARDLVLCSVVKAELLFGARKSQRTESNLLTLDRFFKAFKSLTFDDRSAEEYGQIKALLAVQGNLIGPNDLMIAAIARAHDATLVTNNTGEFSRVTGLRLEDWQA
ncbi:type II toxin-antitoxin system tRNA(fMet)-specific endonuclease VapC [Leucothrix pacifica]|uniref:Ribonuclease VapC n=1 Tax=Leucothrix pacifica TaxID=1247513 RepID=A0A317C4Y3_9GAMM|nr:type II toxin-antitoxin system VapC family toxin [Leucothrix pacifica]PWQ93339.1 VapC toxin family PIN domain ribonuclease [Leucothrix pacifica]